MVKLRRVALTALVILTIPGGFPCRAAMPTTNAEYGPSPELVAPTKSILPTIRVAKAKGLNSPIGMALVGNTLYVANSDAVLSFPYRSGDTELRSEATRLTALPAGTINHHWTKSLLASPDRRHLYVGVGSNSNAGENGLDAEHDRAAVWEIDIQTGKHRTYASGLRNPVGLAWEPQSGALWVAVNERDELGDHVPPDYMTALHDGGFYACPLSDY